MRSIVAWYSALGQREQRLLAAMLILLAAMLLYLLLYAPLSAAYTASVQEHLVAVDRHGRAKALGAAPPDAGDAPDATHLAQYLADNARQRGVEATVQGGATSATVTVASAAPSALLSWLSELESSGLRLDPVRIADGGSGSVSSSFTVERGQR